MSSTLFVRRATAAVAVGLIAAACSSSPALIEGVDTTTVDADTTTSAAPTTTEPAVETTASTTEAPTTTVADQGDSAIVASIAIGPADAFASYEYEDTSDSEAGPSGCDGVDDPEEPNTTAESSFDLTGGHFLSGTVQAFDSADAAATFLEDRIGFIQACSGLPSTEDGEVTITTVDGLTEVDIAGTDQAFQFDLVLEQGALAFRVSTSAVRVDRFLIISFGSARDTERSMSTVMIARANGEAEPDLVAPVGTVEFFDIDAGEQTGDSSFNESGYSVLQALLPELESRVGPELFAFVSAINQDDLDPVATEICQIFDAADRTAIGGQEAAFDAISAIDDLPGSEDLELRSMGEAIGFVIVAYCPSNADIFDT